MAVSYKLFCDLDLDIGTLLIIRETSAWEISLSCITENPGSVSRT